MGDRLATIDIGRKGVAAVPLSAAGWGLGPILPNLPWAEIYLRTKWHFDGSSRLATSDMGQKLGVVPPVWGKELGLI